MKIVATSDVHGHLEKIKIPDGDVLIVAGDILADYDYNFGAIITPQTMRLQQLEALKKLNVFLGTLPHRLKILIGGNHDYVLEDMEPECRAAITNAVYLRDEEHIFEGVKFYGYPWVPNLRGMAFFAEGAWRKKYCEKIPHDVDVMISHGPPYGIMDKVREEYVGCVHLLKEVDEIAPRLHIFGHIHHAYGRRRRGETEFYNVACCNGAYEPVNPPIVAEIERRTP